VAYDYRALKIYTDGSALKNPGGPGGIAACVVYPEEIHKEDELLFQEGFKSTTNNRMELLACIRALEHLQDHGSGYRVERVQIITDSKYVHKHIGTAELWRDNGWKRVSGAPLENADLWKRFLSLRSRRLKLRVEFYWAAGKKTPILKKVDKAAKAAAQNPWETDWGFRGGKVARSKAAEKGAAAPFPASGQTATIRIYRSRSLSKTDHKLYFDVADENTGEFTNKASAFASPAIAGALHRQHIYRVRFNDNKEYPLIEVVEGELDPHATTARS
jgi:ribonuclease HI